MTSSGEERKGERGFPRMILDDLRRPDLRRTYRRDLRDIFEFYLDEEDRDRLAGMSRFRRWILLTVWLLKGLARNLSPARRLLVLLSFLLYLQSGFRIEADNVSIQFLDLRWLGFLVLLLVLMLELRDKLLARSELEVGRAVQLALLPVEQPRLEGWDIWLFTRPANDVGGDLVDALEVGPGRLGLALGDVAGKGLGAALLTSKLQATLRALATEGDSLAAFGARLNRIFCRDQVPGRFTTLAYLEVEAGSGEVRLLNAGHLPPLVARDAGVEELSPVAPALGLLADAEFEEQGLTLRPGEGLIVYSDGLTEARNSEGSFFGETRLLDLLRGAGRRIAEETGAQLLGAVEEFVGEERVSDDLSLIVLRRTGAA